MSTPLVIFLLVVLAAAAGLAIWFGVQIDALRKRYAPFVDLEKATAESQRAIESQRRMLQEERDRLAAEYAALKEEMQRAHQRERDAIGRMRAETEVDCQRLREETLAKFASTTAALAENEKRLADLTAQVKKVEEVDDLLDCGHYRPHYDFETSAAYKAELERICDRAAEMLKTGKASKCASNWSVGGSEKEGARMVKQYTKLMLRAFNGECDAATAKVSWNNVEKMEARIARAHEVANELGETMQISITSGYLAIKLAELRLTHEHAEKRHAEQEEQKRIREQMREEERARREIEKAKEEAEKEEARAEKALAKAREEAAAATGARLADLQAKIAALEQQAATAHQQKERAMSRAQMTKSGNVYVISNIGSFGEGVFKVGMTRRLDPMDRIFELGDASVPFPFDVHAMLPSDDAPGLEAELHRLLVDHRVNMVNERKEFFRVSLETIQAIAKDRGQQVEFTLLAQAQEYRETKALRENGAKPQWVEAERPRSKVAMAVAAESGEEE